MNIWGDKVKRDDKKKLCNKIFGRLFLGLLIAFMAIFLNLLLLTLIFKFLKWG